MSKGAIIYSIQLTLRKKILLEKMKNWWRYLDKKLFRPMMRQHKNPSYLARSTAVGMALAFSPFPGQIPVVSALWLLFRKFKWRFSLAIAIAWTFISNMFTNLPLFYLYYKTGDLILDRESRMSYKELGGIFEDGMFDGIRYMISELGGSIFIGSLFFMIVFGFLGYAIGHSLALYNNRLKKMVD